MFIFTQVIGSKFTKVDLQLTAALSEHVDNDEAVMSEPLKGIYKLMVQLYVSAVFNSSGPDGVVARHPGNFTIKVEPSLTMLVTVISAECATAMDFAMARPSPNPPELRLRTESAL